MDIFLELTCQLALLSAGEPELVDQQTMGGIAVDAVDKMRREAAQDLLAVFQKHSLVLMAKSALAPEISMVLGGALNLFRGAAPFKYQLSAKKLEEAMDAQWPDRKETKPQEATEPQEVLADEATVLNGLADHITRSSGPNRLG